MASVRWCIRIHRRHTQDTAGLCNLLEESDHQLQFCVQPAEVAALGWCSLLKHAGTCRIHLSGMRLFVHLHRTETRGSPNQIHLLEHIGLFACAQLDPSTTAEDRNQPGMATTCASSRFWFKRSVQAIHGQSSARVA